MGASGVVGSGASAAEPDAHLFAGARAFQAGRFGEALEAFRAAEAGGERGAAWYAAAALHKLGDTQGALAAFLDAEAKAPQQRDELLDFYFASACAESRLYLAADRLLASVLGRAGPRIAEHAERMRAELAPVLRGEPPESTIDWYLGQARAALDAGRPRLARAYFEEAQAWGRRARPSYRVVDAEDGLGLTEFVVRAGGEVRQAEDHAGRARRGE
jgi:tetratricopeptide (TPR) repeat protein